MLVINSLLELFNFGLLNLDYSEQSDSFLLQEL